MSPKQQRNVKSTSSGSHLRAVQPPLVPTWLAMLVVSVFSFFAGTLYTMHAGIDKCANDNQVQMAANQRFAEEIKCPVCSIEEEADSEDSTFTFTESVHKYAVGMSRVTKEDFVQHIDPGVPLDAPKAGEEEVLILYSRHGALPNEFTPGSTMRMHDAVENCEMLNLILTDNSGHRDQCVAIMPQYESYHIQKWMRIPPDGHGASDKQFPLQMVSRGYQANGREQFEPPPLPKTRQNWDLLQNYIGTIDHVLDELRPILKRIAKDNTVIVMVCNFGQSELLLNFVCTAKARGLDISQVLVFATDEETRNLAESIGVAAFYDQRNFGNMPEDAAGRYGDRKFVAMMMAKVICVHMISMLGYDYLFQDVDIVWYKNPLEYFQDKQSPFYHYDIYFQDDGGHTTRYAPYSANSGFYFVRHNDRTVYFMSALLQAGDLILKTDSHQQALIATLNEHVSLYGLRAKVLSRDMDEFPGGYHFHQHSGKYMKAFFSGDKHPYIFHMSWTKNKDNKILFMKQMGEWHLNDVCIAKPVSEILGDTSDSLPAHCCAAEPLVSCHYRDKPSKIPCKDFPPIDKGKKSFW